MWCYYQYNCDPIISGCFKRKSQVRQITRSSNNRRSWWYRGRASVPFSATFVSPVPRNKWGRFQPRITHWSRWIRRRSDAPQCHRAVRDRWLLGRRVAARIDSTRFLSDPANTPGNCVSFRRAWGPSFDAFNAAVPLLFCNSYNDGY